MLGLKTILAITGLISETINLMNPLYIMAAILDHMNFIASNGSRMQNISIISDRLHLSI